MDKLGVIAVVALAVGCQPLCGNGHVCDGEITADFSGDAPRFEVVGSSGDSLTPNSFFVEDSCGATVRWGVDGLDEAALTYGVVPEGAEETTAAQPLEEGTPYHVYFGVTRANTWSSEWGASFVHGQPETFTPEITECAE